MICKVPTHTVTVEVPLPDLTAKTSTTRSDVFYFDEDGERYPFRIRLRDRYNFHLALLETEHIKPEEQLTVQFHFWVGDHCSDCNQRSCNCFSCDHFTDVYFLANDCPWERYAMYPHDFVKHSHKSDKVEIRLHILSMESKPRRDTPWYLFNEKYLENMTIGSQHILGDFSIKVEKQKFSASKYMLSTHSEVFKTMFNGNMVEAKTNCLTITDFSAETVKALLDCLHSCGKIFPKETQELEDLYYLADKYNVEVVAKRCVIAMQMKVIPETIIRRTYFAFKNNEPLLKLQVVSFIQTFSSLPEVLYSDEFARYQREDPEVCLEILRAITFVR